MHVLKSLQDVVYSWSEARVSHQDVLQEVDQVDVIVDLLEPTIFKQIQLRLCQPHKEVDVLVGIE